MKMDKWMTAAALSAAITVAEAGDLTVEGALNVTSNLAARTLSVTNAAVGALVVEGPAVFAGPLAGDGSAITNLAGANLAPGSVGAASLAAGAVSADKIPAGAISGAHIAAGAAIDPSRIAGLTNALDALGAHAAAANNPHGVTAAQIGALTSEADPVALAALAHYASANNVTRWQDSADSNIWWEANGGTNITVYQKEFVEMGLNIVFNSDFKDGADNSTLYPLTLPFPFNTNGWSGSVDEFISGEMAAFVHSPNGAVWVGQPPSSGCTLYPYYSGSPEGNAALVSRLGWTTNVLAVYSLPAGDVWQALSSLYPASNPSNYVSASAVDGIVAAATANLLASTGSGSQLTGITAAQVGAYTVNQTDAAISSALAGFEPGAGVLTNHVGDVKINGAVQATALAGDGASVTNLNLAAYAGDNLTWAGGRLHAEDGGPGYTDAQAVAAVTAADLDMNAHRVTGVAAPAADSDAITKAYLRAVLSALPPQGNLSMGAYTNGAPASFPLEF